MSARVALAMMALCACGDNVQVQPDAPQPRPIDAAPDAGPPPDAPPDDPCAYLETFEAMPNYPIRFNTGQGLEASPDLRQTGLLELRNADISNRDVIEKRAGAVQLGDSRSTTPGDDVPDGDRRAIWSRGDEVLLETHDSLYKQQRAVTEFTWQRVAAWTRMRLREFYANTFAGDVLFADAAVFGDALAVVYQEGTNGSQFVAYGPTMSRELIEEVSATGTRTRLSSVEDFAVITFQNQIAGFPLVARTWTPGSDNTSPLATIAAVMPAAAGVWDVHSAKTADAGDLVTAWAVAEPTANDMTLTVRMGSVVGTVTRNRGTAIQEVAVAVWPRRVSGLVRAVVVEMVQIAGNWRAQTTAFDFDPTTGALVAENGSIPALTDTASTPRSVAVSYEDRDNVWIAVEQDSGATRKVSYYSLPIAGALTASTVHEATSLVTQGAILAGTPSDTLVSAGAEPLSPGFVEQLLTLATSPTGDQIGARSGWIVFAPRTEEIVARSFVGYTGDLSTRSTRPPKGSLIANGDLITWAGPAAVQSDPSTTLRAVAVCKLDRTARANKPAELDKTAISAHAGYARAYDGTSAFEHAWHTLPRVTGIATGGAGTTTAGEHRVAVTWEADDANGLRYESAPNIAAASITSAGTGIQVTFESLTHTERPSARAVVWMTVVGGATYYRAAEAAVSAAASTQTINVAILDGTLANKPTLRQAPVPAGQGILPSLQDRVTDFVALLLDRLASRDPLVGSLMTFTIPSQEATGYSAHWAGGVVQEPLERDVTSAIEMDGRIIMGSALGLAQIVQDGPSATGQGDFGLPLVLRAPVGIEDHATTERTPIGYVFGSSEGPRLLSPGLAVTHLDEAVERHYAIDGGHMVAAAWDALREEIMLLDDTIETLRLNPHNARWAEDSDRTGRDLTVRGDGVVYVLRDDGKVLVQDPDTFSDGASDYVLRVTTPWVREPARDQLAHGGYLFNGVEVYGEYLGSHDLKVTVHLDFRDTITIFEGTIPAATIDANAVAGRDYRYALYTEARHCYACKVVVETSAEPNATARIAGIDVRWNPDNSPNPAQVAEEQRFPLDVSSYG